MLVIHDNHHLYSDKLELIHAAQTDQCSYHIQLLFSNETGFNGKFCAQKLFRAVFKAIASMDSNQAFYFQF